MLLLCTFLKLYFSIKKKGDNCTYSHDVEREKKKEICKFYLQESCTKGDDCLYYHGMHILSYMLAVVIVLSRIKYCVTFVCMEL